MSGKEQAGDFCWDGLSPLALHPVRVEIIEALLWIGRPLSATDLVQVFEARRSELRVEYHLRQLFKLGIVQEKGCDVGPAPMGQRSYCLAGRAML